MGFWIGFGISMAAFGVMCLAVWILDLKFKCNKLKTENQILCMEYRVLLARNQHKATHMHINSVSDGTVEAVRYAMKKAHPDNGGNAEDFIKFKKVYEELTK